MTTLHLGVVDIPYAKAPPAKGARKKVASGTQTTGDVAGFLESKYHVMEVFFEEHKEEIGDAIVGSLRDALETHAQGGLIALDPFGGGTATVESLFRHFLDSKEMDRLGVPGVPTEAALKGVSHRHASNRGVPGRPSFIDTGLYETSFKAWVD